jgi:hypothetical protein
VYKRRLHAIVEIVSSQKNTIKEQTGRLNFVAKVYLTVQEVVPVIAESVFHGRDCAVDAASMTD